MLKPLNQRVVLVKEKHEDKQVGGLLLPGKKEADNVAKVVAVAEGVSGIKAGDTVVFDPFAVAKVEDAGQEYLLVKDEDIFAVVEGE